jgi:hypothetical protein
VKVVYVAGPFRGPTPWDVAENVRQAERLGLEVARLGAMPLIPHANTSLFDGQLSAKFWLDGTLELLRRSDAMILTPDWEQSSGARAEFKDALERRQPVFYTLGELAAWLGVAP